MKIPDFVYQGSIIDDMITFDQLPNEYKNLLTKSNGFIRYGGGLHIRGACHKPYWHSISYAWNGEGSFFRQYKCLKNEDIPFGQDMLGDQFLLRDNFVYKLFSETGELETLNCNLDQFIKNAESDPIDYLGLQPLIRFYQEGGTIKPGQLLSVYPPFCTEESAKGISLKAVSVDERLRFLAYFSSQMTKLEEGEKFDFKVDK